MAAISTSSMLDSTFEVDKLTNEIFSILENKFLFPKSPVPKTNQIHDQILKSNENGKIRILSIDGNGTTDGILAAKSLTHLEIYLRRNSGDPSACIADYFDVVAGTSSGGILAALLFTRGNNGRPMFTADEALKFLIKNRVKIFPARGIFRRIFRPAKIKKFLRKTFGESTLKDTLKSVLIPCYDLSTRAPFLFSRADALEIDGYDFKMRDVCFATSADPTVVGAVEMRSVDRRTNIMAVGGGIAMNNPTAAAITHVLNNKQEFPLCNGLEDLMVVSLGNGDAGFGIGVPTSSPARFVRIAGEGASDMVDQAVSMAFGQGRANNYVRIQAECNMTRSKMDILGTAEEMLAHKNVESVLFKGKKMGQTSNSCKLELCAKQLIEEQNRRKTCILPTVVLKQLHSSLN